MANFITVTLSPAIDCTLSVRDDLRIGKVHNVVAEIVTPGGKGINVAKAIAGAGCAVLAGGILGKAETDMYSLFLAESGIGCNFLPVNYPTRRNIMAVDESGRELKLNRPGFPEMAFDRSVLHEYGLQLAEGCDVVVVSGSLPGRFPPDTYAELITLFKSQGKIVVLDTAGESLKFGLDAGPDVIKPNRSELSEIIGAGLESSDEIVGLLGELSRKHEIVILSDGSNGAWFACAGAVFFGNAPPVKPVDTTGAGDAMLGRFCAGYFTRSNRNLSSVVMREALAAGSACVEQYGTPMLSDTRIVELSEKIVMEEC